MGTTENLALVDKLFKSIEAGDVETIRNEVYTDETLVWHNFDNLAQSSADNLELLKFVVAGIEGLKYDQIRRYPIEGGVAQQHVLTGTAKTGPFELPASMFLWISDGRIVRIEEYLDSVQLGKLSG